MDLQPATKMNLVRATMAKWRSPDIESKFEAMKETLLLKKLITEEKFEIDVPARRKSNRSWFRHRGYWYRGPKIPVKNAKERRRNTTKKQRFAFDGAATKKTIRIKSGEHDWEHDWKNFCSSPTTELWVFPQKVFIQVEVQRFNSDFQSRKDVWLVMDWSQNGNHLFLSRSTTTYHYPKELSNIKDYGCGCGYLGMDSGILIAGGCKVVDDSDTPNQRRGLVQRSKVHPSGNLQDSNSVFMYHPDHNTWKQLPNMLTKRGCFPTVIGTLDNIFVFGGNRNSSFSNEFYNDKSKAWSYFCQPPSGFSNAHIHTVCPCKSLILFWVEWFEVFSFNYKSFEWKQYHHSSSIFRSPSAGLSNVVIGNFLIWNDHKTIYAHNLHVDSTFPVCVLPTSGYFASDEFHMYGNYRDAFLVLCGKRLCLFGKIKNSSSRQGFWYITFLVQITRTFKAEILHLAVHQTGVFNTSRLGVTTPIVRIKTALELKTDFNTPLCGRGMLGYLPMGPQY